MAMGTTIFDNNGGRDGGDSFRLSRYTGPAGDRRRYQITIYGQTDNCGYRHAWMTMSHNDLRKLALAIDIELEETGPRD